MDLIPKFIPQDIDDCGKSLPLVMTGEVFDILQKERARLLAVDDPRYIEEQGALCFVGETMGAAEGVLLRNARDGEWLARKTGKQNVMIGDVISFDLRDVSGEAVPRRRREVRYVCLYCELIPLAREHASTAVSFEPLTHAPNSGEQIDESESSLFRVLFERQRQKSLTDCITEVWGWG
jgi:hypothetical protein